MDGAISGTLTFTLPAHAPVGKYTIIPVGIPIKSRVGASIGPGYMSYGKTNAIVFASFSLSSSGTITNTIK